MNDLNVESGMRHGGVMQEFPGATHRISHRIAHCGAVKFHLSFSIIGFDWSSLPFTRAKIPPVSTY